MTDATIPPDVQEHDNDRFRQLVEHNRRETEAYNLFKRHSEEPSVMPNRDHSPSHHTPVISASSDDIAAYYELQIRNAKIEYGKTMDEISHLFKKAQDQELILDRWQTSFVDHLKKSR